MNFIILVMLMMLPFCSLSQNGFVKCLTKFSRLATKVSHLASASLGANMISKGFTAHPGFDDLNSYNSNNGYFRLSSAMYFYERFGIELAYQGNVSTIENFNGFKSYIESKYGSDYYIHYNSYVDKSTFTFTTELLLVGPAFKFQYKRFHFMPKVLFGSMSFLPTDATVYLKRKNSNEYITETYKAVRSNPGTFSMNAGLNIMYFVYRGLWGGLAVNMDLNYNECRVNPNALVYTITTTNIITGTEEISSVNYHQALRQFSLGLGVSYYFKIGNVWQGQ